MVRNSEGSPACLLHVVQEELKGADAIEKQTVNYFYSFVLTLHSNLLLEDFFPPKKNSCFF